MVEMTEAVMIGAAAAAAIKFHAGQTDRAGVPFYHHLLRVGTSMSPDPEAMVIGYLHDLVEDTDQTIEDVAEAFGAEIAGNIYLLTRVSSESYWEYLDRLIAGSKVYPKALLVKRADLLDNLAPWRQTFPGAESLARRHEIALSQVESNLVARGLLNESEVYVAVRRNAGSNRGTDDARRNAVVASNGASDPAELSYLESLHWNVDPR